MIIILNGMLGTNIDNIAKMISITLNNDEKIFNFDIDSNNSFNLNIVDDESNSVIHVEDSEKIQLPDSGIERFENLMRTSVIEELKSFYLSSYLCDIGQVKQPDFFDDFGQLEYVYNKKSYLPREIHRRRIKSGLETFVICGQIGYYMINELKEEFKNEEVLVYNITRHPIISEFTNEIFYNGTKKRTYVYDCFNSYYLSARKDVITLKFEDFFKEPIIKINTKKVFLSEEFKSDSELFSSFELDNAKIKENKNKLKELEELEEKYKNIDFIKLWLDEFKETDEEIQKILLKPLLEITYDIIDKLNYFKIKDYNEI